MDSKRDNVTPHRCAHIIVVVVVVSLWPPIALLPPRRSSRKRRPRFMAMVVAGAAARERSRQQHRARAHITTLASQHPAASVNLAKCIRHWPRRIHPNINTARVAPKCIFLTRTERKCCHSVGETRSQRMGSRTQGLNRKKNPLYLLEKH